MLKVEDVSNFIDGNFNYHLNDKTQLPSFIKEQVLFRIITCIDCTLRGSCKHCGCKTPAMYFAPLKRDEEGNWPSKFLSLKEWEEYLSSQNPLSVTKFLKNYHTNPMVVEKYFKELNLTENDFTGTLRDYIRNFTSVSSDNGDNIGQME